MLRVQRPFFVVEKCWKHILIWIYLVSILCVTGLSDVLILVVKGSLVRKHPSYEQRRSSWEKRYLSQIQPAKWSLSKEISHSSDSSIYSFIHPSVHAFIRDSWMHWFIGLLVHWIIGLLIFWFTVSWVHDSSIHWPTLSLIHWFINHWSIFSLLHGFTDSLFHSLIDSQIHCWFTDSLVQSFQWRLNHHLLIRWCTSQLHSTSLLLHLQNYPIRHWFLIAGRKCLRLPPRRGPGFTC